MGREATVLTALNMTGFSLCLANERSEPSKGIEVRIVLCILKTELKCFSRNHSESTW